MKRLLPLVFGAALLSFGQARAQDKPVLNTAPPGTPVPRPVEPAPAPLPPPVREQPAPRPTPPPAAPPSPDSPSGLNFPVREVPPTPMKRKFIYANAGLGYSSYNRVGQFNFSIAPALGYRITEKFAVGPGISYTYNNYSVPNGSNIFITGENSLATSSIGLKGFAQYIVYKEFFAHAEYEVTQAELLGRFNTGQYGVVKRTITTPLAGIGYRQAFSDDAAFDIVLLYNFNDGYDALYSNPVIRFSFLFNIGR